MAVEGIYPHAVVYNHRVPVDTQLARVCHYSAVGRFYRIPLSYGEVVSEMVLFVDRLFVEYVCPLVREIRLNLRIGKLMKLPLPQYIVLRARAHLFYLHVVLLPEVAVHLQKYLLVVGLPALARKRGHDVLYKIGADVQIALPVRDILERIGHVRAFLVACPVFSYKCDALARRDVIRIGEKHEIHVVFGKFPLVARKEIAPYRDTALHNVGRGLVYNQGRASVVDVVLRAEEIGCGGGKVEVYFSARDGPVTGKEPEARAVNSGYTELGGAGLDAELLRVYLNVDRVRLDPFRVILIKYHGFTPLLDEDNGDVLQALAFVAHHDVKGFNAHIVGIELDIYPGRVPLYLGIDVNRAANYEYQKK